MQEYEARKETKQILTNVKCNKCGKKMAGTYPDPTTGGGDRVSEVIGLAAEVDGGYSSTHLFDCVKYSFDMCEECLVKLFESFVIPVKKQEIMLLL